MRFVVKSTQRRPEGHYTHYRTCESPDELWRALERAASHTPQRERDEIPAPVAEVYASKDPALPQLKDGAS